MCERDGLLLSSLDEIVGIFVILFVITQCGPIGSLILDVIETVRARCRLKASLVSRPGTSPTLLHRVVRPSVILFYSFLLLEQSCSLCELCLLVVRTLVRVGHRDLGLP